MSRGGGAKMRLMVDDESWVKLYRRITKWGWWKNPTTAHLFMHLLLNANWETNIYNGITIQPGQLVTGRDSLSRDTGLTVNQVRGALERLKTTNEITITSNTKFSVITICKWLDYQCDNQQLHQQTTNKPPTNHQQTTTPKEYKKERSKEGKNNNTPTPQGGENILPMNLPKVEKPTRFDEFWKSYPRKEAKDQALTAYKNALKNITENELIHAVKVMRSKFDNDDRETKEKLKYCKFAQGWLNGKRYLDYIDQEIEEDDTKMPEGMTPQEHAEWVMRYMGDTP